MDGQIEKMIAVPGQREELIWILLEGTTGEDAVPGCLNYAVAADPADENGLWVTEVWDREESHQASRSLPSVQQAISRGRPLIVGIGERFVTAPGGGKGLNPAGWLAG